MLFHPQGVNQVIVVVNKMDSTTPAAWSESRCHVIEAAIRALLCEEMHFNPQYVRIVPLSGLTGQNIVALDEDCALKSWYSGPTLLQAIDSFVVPPRGVDRPLRAVVHEVVAADTNRGKYELEVSVLQGKLSTDRTVGFYDLACVPQSPLSTAFSAPIVPAADSAAKPSKYQVGTTTVTSSISGAAGNAASEGYKSATVLKAGERGTISLSSKYVPMHAHIIFISVHAE